MYEISVVIPLYNVEKYIAECLESLVKQTIFKKMKIIVINDGSTDSSANIVEEYTQKYENIELHNFNNEGVASARNHGIDMVSTDYIAFVDPDDYVHPLMYEDLLGNIKNDNSDICICSTTRTDGETMRVPNIHRLSCKDEYHSVGYSEIPKLAYDMSTCNKLYRYKLFQEHKLRYPVNKLYEDIYLSIQAYGYSNKITVLNRIYYYWRVREGSITASKANSKNLKDRIEMVNESHKYMLDNGFDSDFIEDFLEKSFRYDFLYYIDILNEVDNKEYEKIINEDLVPFLINNKEFIINNVCARDKVKYYFIMNMEYEKLHNYLNDIQRTDHVGLNIEGSEFSSFGNRQNEYLKYRINTEDCVICNNELQEIENDFLTEKTDFIYNPFVKSLNINLSQNVIQIEGGIVHHSLKLKDNNMQIKLELLNIETNATTKLDTLDYNFVEDSNYVEFKTNVPLSKLSGNNTYKILIRIGIDDYKISTILMSPINQRQSRAWYKLNEDKSMLYSANYNLRKELCIYSKIPSRLLGVENVINKDIILRFDQTITNEDLYLESIDKYDKIEVTTDKINANSLSSKEKYIVKTRNTNDCFSYAINDLNGPGYCFDIDNENLLIVNRSRMGYLYIEKSDKQVLINDIWFNKNEMKIGVKIENEKLPKDIKVFLVSQDTKKAFKRINDSELYFDVNSIKVKGDKQYNIEFEWVKKDYENIKLNPSISYGDKKLKNITLKSNQIFFINPYPKNLKNRLLRKMGLI